MLSFFLNHPLMKNVTTPFLIFMHSLREGLRTQTPKEFFLWMPVCLALGSGIYFSFPIPMLSWWYAWSFLTLIFFGVLWNFFKQKSYFLYGIFYVFLGYTLITLKVIFLNTPLLEKPLYNTYIQGVIEQISDKEDGHQWILNLSSPQNIGKIKLTVKGDMKGHVGDKVDAKVHIFPFHPPIFPGGLNQRRRAYLEGLSGQGHMKKLITITPATTKKDALHTLNHLRRTITESIYTRIHGERGAIAAALITGERSKISFVTRQAFADAGIAHILAISGLHLSLIAGFIFFTLRGGLAAFPKIAENYAIKKWAAFMAIVFTFLYLLISGMGYPSLRAFAMTGIAMFAILVDRSAISMRSLAIAAFVILCMYPDSIISASFQLSFAAVTALIAFYEMGWRPLHLWAKDGGWIRMISVYILGVILSSLIATMATTPFTMFLFNRLTVQSLLGNLFAIPLTGLLVMPSALASTLSLIFGGWQWCFDTFSFSIHLLSKIAFWVQSFPGAAVLVPSLPLSFILCFTVGGLWLTLWRGYFKLIGFAFISASFIIWGTYLPPDILVSQKGIGVYQDGKLTVSKHTGWFEKSMWKRHLGVKDVGELKDDFLGVEASYTDWANNQKSMGILILPDPKEKSYKELLPHCKSGVPWIVTNGYLDRVCTEFYPFESGFSLKNKKIPKNVLLSRTSFGFGIAAIWLTPLHIEFTDREQQNKPWG